MGRPPRVLAICRADCPILRCDAPKTIRTAGPRRRGGAAAPSAPSPKSRQAFRKRRSRRSKARRSDRAGLRLGETISRGSGVDAEARSDGPTTRSGKPATDHAAANRPRRDEAARRTAPLRTARGTSMGGRATAKERAGAGLMPVAGLDVTLEEAEATPQGAVTATVEALSRPDREGPPGIPRPYLGPAPSAAAGEERRRRAAQDRLRLRAEGRPAGGDRGAGAGHFRSRRAARRCCSASPARARPSPWPR